MSGKWYTRKSVVFGMHVLFWALFLALPFLLRPVSDSRAHTDEKPDGMYYLHFIKNFLWISLFYFNAYFLIPVLFYTRKYKRYILALLASLLFIWLADRFMFALLMQGYEYRLRNFLVFNLPVFIFITLASTAFRTIRDRITEDSEKQQRQNENLKTELSFLRSQVSPHFMFNILNNMVALARKKSDILEPSLIKLSSLLRYMLYETDEDKVLLDKEVDYLQSYIDLQRLRFGKNVQINTELQQTAIAYTIEPMLLIPFVENAFKHGVGMIEDAQIDVNLKVEKDQLYFSVRNKFSAASENEPKDKTSGIGLANVKRRLNLLYHQNHSLMIDKRDGWFTVSLQLKLH
ncbi:GHKL domain-containing protein [Lacibacter luteus]|uniref:GHKL domain-containing protein n=1 Tax=Lacibacter luteus TaxID=2508719 RepID=A0A4Q1CIA7_9BACT|nr:histidine kinase [Lacibacter luteus]RXK59891.1 GHKL domain-containing protein [Lacibacter luteus]